MENSWIYEKKLNHFTENTHYQNQKQTLKEDTWIVFRRTIQEAIRILTKRYKKEQNIIKNKEYTTPTE